MTRTIVSIFCGGRGSSSLIRELIRRPDVDVNVLINAYDDGLSTGALRRLIPGMLGPSDFRKNLARVLELSSRQQLDLVRVIEHRLASGTQREALTQLLEFMTQGRSQTTPLADLFTGLDRPLVEKLGAYLRTFLEYLDAQQQPFDFSDCALGNLLFAGAYLQNGRHFNAAVAALTQAMGCTVRLINVSRDENRILVGLKSDGRYLDSEAAIVAPNGPGHIVGVYLLPRPLDDAELRQLNGLDLAARQSFLAAKESPVEISPEANAALRDSDVIIYGPGTQFSSLLPSYKAVGLLDALSASRAKVKALVVNLRADHDTEGLTADDIVETALTCLCDKTNASSAVTHAIYNSSRASDAVVRRTPPASIPNVKWIEGDFERPDRSGIHNGDRSIREILSLGRLHRGHPSDRLDVYVDLHERSVVADLLAQEFGEVDWTSRFANVRLTVNGIASLPAAPPSPLETALAKHPGLFSEVDAFRQWWEHGTSEYLATITGDGELRLHDILLAIRVLDSSGFAAVYGSRAQSRRQAVRSLRHAYGESLPLFWLSWAGGYAFSALFALRFRVTLSDPFTGFRVYRRSALRLPPTSLSRLTTPTHISRLLLTSDHEIAEIPVSYRSFRGYTNRRTRLTRGLRNMVSLF